MARTHRVNYHPGNKYWRQTSVMKCIVNSCICLDVLSSFCSHLSYNKLQDLSPGLFDHSTWLKEDWVEYHRILRIYRIPEIWLKSGEWSFLRLTLFICITKKIQCVCESISGYFVVLARICLAASTLDYIEMQVRKKKPLKGLWLRTRAQ